VNAAAGVDGTRYGWVVVVTRSEGLDTFAARRLDEVLERTADCAAVAVDMPIGLLEAAERGGRECERLARAEMPGRASSVFNSPCRAALEADDTPTASSLNRASSAHGIGLSAQSVALFPKLREVDGVLTPEIQHRVFEVHPELCFTALAKAACFDRMLRPKSSFIGLLQRVELLKGAGLDVMPLLERSTELKAKEDDVLDAAVAAWTATRRVSGEAQRYPTAPPKDRRGLFMEMWA
jgi:predicted RNase H-like nuclease